MNRLLGSARGIAIGGVFFVALALFELATGQSSSAAFSGLVAVFLFVVAAVVHRRRSEDDEAGVEPDDRTP